MKPITIKSLLLICTLTFTLISCKKDEISREPVDSDVTTAEDNRSANRENDAIIEAMNRVAYDNGVNKTATSFLPSCATVTIDTTSATRRITIDFGTTGCVCSAWDGRTRKGQVISTWTGRYRDSLTVITTTTNNYYVDGNQHIINRTVTNNGRNGAGNYTFSVVSNNSIVTPTGTISWAASRTREWISGYSTMGDLSDDVYLITGTANGINRAGVAFTASISSALRVELGCVYKIVSGKEDITPSGKPTRYVDYGTGACDGTFTVTISGITYTVGM